MPAARLVSVYESDSHCVCRVEKRAGWLSLSVLDCCFLAIGAYLRFQVGRSYSIRSRFRGRASLPYRQSILGRSGCSFPALSSS